MFRSIALGWIACLAILSAGCQQLFSPVDEKVVLELLLSPDPLPEGEAANVTLTIRNHGARHYRLERTESMCMIMLYLDDSPDPQRPCNEDLRVVALSARGSWSQTHRWLPRTSTDSEAPLPPGEYRLVGRIEGTEMTLVSEPVTFRVVAR